MMVEKTVHVNDVLKELVAIQEEVDKLEKQNDRLQATINQLRGRQRAIGDKVWPMRDRQRKLIKAADALESDWREWHWVKEAGFVTKLPPIVTQL